MKIVSTQQQQLACWRKWAGAFSSCRARERVSEWQGWRPSRWIFGRLRCESHCCSSGSAFVLKHAQTRCVLNKMLQPHQPDMRKAAPQEFVSSAQPAVKLLTVDQPFWSVSQLQAVILYIPKTLLQKTTSLRSRPRYCHISKPDSKACPLCTVAISGHFLNNCLALDGFQGFFLTS